MGILVKNCKKLIHEGAGKVWALRLLRPTLGKKFFVIFAFLALTGLANWLLVEATFSKMRGMAAVVNVTGSLRWLSQRIHAETTRFVHGDTLDRVSIDVYLARLDEAIYSLEYGGSAHGIEIEGLPETLAANVASVSQAAASLRRLTELALWGKQEGADARERLNDVYLVATAILEKADAIAAALTRESEKAEAEAMQSLWVLGMLDLAVLMLALFAIRIRIVAPLRKLASVSTGFAGGRRDMRSGFRSLDEIGQVAAAFDGMADHIERDMRQLAANAAELERREVGLRKFSQAIEHSPASVVITDAAGVIEYVNSKFSNTTGYAREEAVGRQPNLLKSGQMPDKVYVDLWATLQSGQEWNGELLNLKKNGELFWEDVRISPLKDDKGRITHFIAVKEDITQRKRAETDISNHNALLEQRVAERTRRLTESYRELESFSYSISHDLRAPLRGINGFANLMAENCGDCRKPEALEYMARIQRASVRMGNLIDDLLDLSMLSRREIKLEEVDLSAMAFSILDDMSRADASRKVEADVQAGMLLRGDATLLHDLLENLVGNAWKFSAQRDPARIAIGCREENGERVFFIRDNGAGFDMKYADKLFGAFQRLHGPREFEGNGIGLAMVQRIVALHGGRVWAESSLGEGATFYFTIGLKPKEPIRFQVQSGETQA